MKSNVQGKTGRGRRDASRLEKRIADFDVPKFLPVLEVLAKQDSALRLLRSSND
jgi:hypothetical protein